VLNGIPGTKAKETSLYETPEVVAKRSSCVNAKDRCRDLFSSLVDDTAHNHRRKIWSENTDFREHKSAGRPISPKYGQTWSCDQASGAEE